MIIFLFFSKTLILLSLWWFIINSKYWHSKLFIQLILFITPTFFGLVTTALTLFFIPLEVIRKYVVCLYIYSSVFLVLLIPQWYKFAWMQLIYFRKKNIQEDYGLIITILFAIIMIFAMVLLFAMYYLWIHAISGNSQGLLSAQYGYSPISMDFFTAIYFSFVTYFTLGYGDLVPYGFWIRSFVFLECIASVINTGVIVIYVYNFLLNSHYPQKTKVNK